MHGLAFQSLADVPGLRHCVTTRALPRAEVPTALDVTRPVLTAEQVHGAAIRAVEGEAEPCPGKADGLSTNASDGPVLGVMGADCPGVLVVAPRQRALAVLHAGWRGVVAGIVPAGLHLLATRYGARAEELLVGVGPGIGVDRYEVSDEVAEAIAASVAPAARDAVVRPGRPGHAQADLRAAIHAQLEQRGVPSTAIEVHPACTYDDERFFSYRRDGPQTGRHLLVATWVDA